MQWFSGITLGWPKGKKSLVNFAYHPKLVLQQSLYVILKLFFRKALKRYLLNCRNKIMEIPLVV